jgi:hypothetical protein
VLKGLFHLDFPEELLRKPFTALFALSLLSGMAMVATVAAFGQSKVHLIHIDPQPSIEAGCPAKVHFSGHIETTGPLDVSYQWLRSDGSHSDATLHFTKATRRDINYTWTIGKKYSGWVQLVILSPAHEQTAKSSFEVNCGK